MKKLFVSITMTVITTASMFAEFAIDTNTGMFYSKNAKNDVDQVEYDDLVQDLVRFADANAYLGSDAAIIASFFITLRAFGTPAALRLIDDLELVVKNHKSDFKKLAF